MHNYSDEELVIINNLMDLLREDVDKSIEFLSIGFGIDEDVLNEMGCLDIMEVVREEITDADFSIIENIMSDFYLDGFDINTFGGVGTIKQPCKNPCPTCPYTKNAVSGYFGGQDPEIYSKALHQDTVIACHTRTKHDKNGLPSSNDAVTICTGHIVSQIKTCKSNIHPDGEKAQKYVRELEHFDKLKENALGFDFNKHHGL